MLPITNHSFSICNPTKLALEWNWEKKKLFWNWNKSCKEKKKFHTKKSLLCFFLYIDFFLHITFYFIFFALFVFFLSLCMLLILRLKFYFFFLHPIMECFSFWDRNKLKRMKMRESERENYVKVIKIPFTQFMSFKDARTLSISLPFPTPSIVTSFSDWWINLSHRHTQQQTNQQSSG